MRNVFPVNLLFCLLTIITVMPRDKVYSLQIVIVWSALSGSTRWLHTLSERDGNSTARQSATFVMHFISHVMRLCRCVYLCARAKLCRKLLFSCSQKSRVPLDVTVTKLYFTTCGKSVVSCPTTTTVSTYKTTRPLIFYTRYNIDANVPGSVTPSIPILDVQCFRNV